MFRSTTFAVLACAFLLAKTNVADAEIPLADLQVVARTLGFINGVTQDGQIQVAVVYAAYDAAGKAQAVQAAQVLSGLQGPNNLRIQALALSAGELATAGNSFDIAFVVPGANSQAALIGSFARQRHVATISDDPRCAQTAYCVLMVRVGAGVQIVLDTALATSIGVSFSPVFMMMVQRK